MDQIETKTSRVFFFPLLPPILAINCTQATLTSPAMQHDTPGSECRFVRVVRKNTRELRRTAICLLRFYKEQDIKWDTSSSSFARLMPSLLIKTRILPSAVRCSLLPRDAVGRCSSARRGGSCVHYYGGRMLSAEPTSTANESRALTPA